MRRASEILGDGRFRIAFAATVAILVLMLVPALAEKARGAREGSERLGNVADRGAQSRESIAM